MGYPKSWVDLNPGWTYRLWTDDDLLAFISEQRPDLLELYLSYSRPVQRADLARYAILQAYGGVYADIDTQCLAPLEPLIGDQRVILCEEPERHHEPALVRGMDRLFFNGTMASPPDHPFWVRVIEQCRMMSDQRDRDVLDTTGPILLTSVVDRWTDPSSLSLNSCGLFAETDVHGKRSVQTPYGSYGHLCLSTHLWKGSWYTNKRPSWWRRKMARLRQVSDRYLTGPKMSPKKGLGLLDRALLRQLPPKGGDKANVLVLIPVKDAEAELPRCFELLRALDHPRDRLHVWFGHGDSSDASAALLDKFLAQYSFEFASMGIIQTRRNAPRLMRSRRWKPQLQRSRRAGIARARNDLLAGSLREVHDWVLWIDADVIDYPPDITRLLMAADAKIVAPHCVLESGGPTFDRNSFVSTATPSRVELYRNIQDGLLQPPAYWDYRRHMEDLKYLDRVPLNGVGGTVLLVDANCHRAGLTFPEVPYRHLIETEAFGQMARDAGVTPVGLPNVEVLHAMN